MVDQHVIIPLKKSGVSFFFQTVKPHMNVLLLIFVSIFTLASCVELIIEEVLRKNELNSMTLNFGRRSGYELESVTFYPLADTTKDASAPMRALKIRASKETRFPDSSGKIKVKLHLKDKFAPGFYYIGIKTNKGKIKFDDIHVLVEDATSESEPETSDGSFESLNEPQILPFPFSLAMETSEYTGRRESYPSEISVRDQEDYNDVFFGSAQDTNGDELVPAWVSFFEENAPKRAQKQSKILLTYNTPTIPAPLRSLVGERYLEDDIIHVALQYWFDTTAPSYNSVGLSAPISNFVLLPPTLVNGVSSQQAPGLLQAYRNELHKQFFMMPYNFGPNSHWFLMIYDRIKGDYFVVDSARRRDARDYQKEVAIFAHILNNYIGLRSARKYGKVELRNINHYRLFDVTKFRNEKPVIHLHSGVARQKDAYNCGIFTVLNGIYFAANSWLLHLIRRDKRIPQYYKFDAEDLVAARKALFVGLGSKCMARSPVLNFPECIGYESAGILNAESAA
jgi:hypothetical protein